MAVQLTRRRFRGLRRSRIKLCERVLDKIVQLSTPPGDLTEFDQVGLNAAAVVLNQLALALEATNPR